MTASEIINTTIAGRRPSTKVADECRWALQRAGYKPSEREAALLAAGVIKQLQQDFGAMVEGIS